MGVTVVGWDGGPLPAGADVALAKATLVAGGARHLAALDGALDPAAGRIVLGDVAAAVRRLREHPGEAAVIASGDPGFFGIVRALRRAAVAPRVIPAVSSVAHAFARLGLPWDDALVVSAHGRDLRRAVNACRAHRKVAVLTAPDAGPAELAEALRGLLRRIVVASRLGMPDERVEELDGDDPAGPAGTPSPEPGPQAAGPIVPGAGSVVPGTGVAGPRRWAEPNVVLVLGEVADDAGPARWVAGVEPGPAGWALPEEEFAHRDSMITKAEVRALVLARLGPRLGDLVWDVGAGSGSVAIECARLGAAAIAVERDMDACADITANAVTHGVDLQVVTGDGPDALAGLPDPDAVFVGGGGPAMLDACLARRPARVVAAFAAVERVGPALAVIAAAGYRTGGAQVQANRLVALPDGAHRLAATNPVTVVWGELR